MSNKACEAASGGWCRESCVLKDDILPGARTRALLEAADAVDEIAAEFPPHMAAGRGALHGAADRLRVMARGQS